jgi:SAM-dependent methyltransferase
VRPLVLRTTPGYRRHLRRQGLTGSRVQPGARRHNAVLQNQQEVAAAVEEVRRLGLPAHGDAPKNWDSLVALDCILRNTDRRARVLDAGATLYSVILQWLFAYGYRNLIGLNLVFTKPVRRGSIRYEPGDLTRTRYPDEYFDAVTCLSVIEHGVDLGGYFREMRRILKPGGVLITSTDYLEDEIDTTHLRAYGSDVHIFSADELRDAFGLAASEGLRLSSEIDLSADETPVHWARLGLDFTFVTFTHVKAGTA